MGHNTGPGQRSTSGSIKRGILVVLTALSMCDSSDLNVIARRNTIHIHIYRQHLHSTESLPFWQRRGFLGADICLHVPAHILSRLSQPQRSGQAEWVPFAKLYFVESSINRSTEEKYFIPYNTILTCTQRSRFLRRGDHAGSFYSAGHLCSVPSRQAHRIGPLGFQSFAIF